LTRMALRACGEIQTSWRWPTCASSRRCSAALRGAAEAQAVGRLGGRLL